eukprot:scaffold74721_cov33-Phaeocystis_antarctica.AAC.1
MSSAISSPGRAHWVSSRLLSASRWKLRASNSTHCGPSCCALARARRPRPRPPPRPRPAAAAAFFSEGRQCHQRYHQRDSGERCLRRHRHESTTVWQKR